MLTVDQIWDDAEEIFGHCNEPKLLRWITDAVRLLANKGEIDPLVGFVDLCISNGCVTLPREVETVLAVNIGGHPALGRDELFSFHLNGPGDFCTPCDWTWVNVGGFPTYRDLQCPGKLVAFLDKEEDEGTELRVFGFDSQNRPLRTQRGDQWEDGILIPTIFGYALPDVNSPEVSRIVNIVKSPTKGNVRLSTFDNSSTTGTLLGVFEHDELIPRYRRIRVNSNRGWVRMMYRRRTFDLTTRYDRIFLHSRLALLLACRAVKKYAETDLGAALAFEAQATRLLSEQESVIMAPVSSPIQVHDRNGMKLPCNEDIS